MKLNIHIDIVRLLVLLSKNLNQWMVYPTLKWSLTCWILIYFNSPPGA